MEGKTFPYICNRGQQVNLHQGRQLILFPSALLASVCWCRQPLSVPCELPSLPHFRTSFVDSYKRKLTIVTVPVSLMALSKTVSFMLYISKYDFYPYQVQYVTIIYTKCNINVWQKKCNKYVMCNVLFIHSCRGVCGAVRCGFGSFLAPYFAVRFNWNHNCTAPYFCSHMCGAVWCGVVWFKF